MDDLFIRAIPGGNSNYYYSYDVYWRGERIVSRSYDPECQAARVLAARGIKGWVVLRDLETGNARLRMHLDALKDLTFQESDSRMRLGKYHPMPLIPKWVNDERRP